MKQLRRSATRRTGASAVEAALVLPILIMFVFGIMEYSRYFMTTHILRTAARAGAEYAAIHTSDIFLDNNTYGSATSDVETIVNNIIGGRQLDSQSINVFLSDATGNAQGSWNNATTGKYICLQITGGYRFGGGGMFALPGITTLTIQAVRRSEGN